MRNDKSKLYEDLDNCTAEFLEKIGITEQAKSYLSDYAPDLSDIAEIDYYWMYRSYPGWEINVSIPWDAVILDRVVAKFVDLGWVLEESHVYGARKPFKLSHPDISENVLIAEISMNATLPKSKCEIIRTPVMKETYEITVICDPENI